MKRISLTIFFIILCLLLSPVFLTKQVVYAAEFELNNIISDSEMQDYNSMDLTSINYFLNTQSGILKTYRGEDSDGDIKSAAEIIFQSAQKYKINPKWILATLQKEQSLISNSSPSQYNLDWAMGYAVCDSCSVDDPQVQLFKGFGTQVDRATWRIRYYYENPYKFNNQVGKLSMIDGKEVYPDNQATANLFNYTPHIHGNYNFWVIWNRWFAKTYPDGTLVKEEGQPGVWVIINGKRRPFWSKQALISRYDESKVITVSRNDLIRYEIGYPIKYPNYSLLRQPDGKIYLVVDDEKKLIESDEVFRYLGYNKDEIIDVDYEELVHYQIGSKITMNSLYPTGALLQDNKTGGVYFVRDGVKYPLIAREIMTINYKGYHLTPVTAEELNKYVTAATPIRLKDGTLIKTGSDSKVYVISNGQRRWVSNEITFKQLGYKWSDIITVNDKVANLHPLGVDLNFAFPDNQIAITQ